MPLFEQRDCRAVDLNNLAGASREAPRPAHAWLLNGGGARPVNQPPRQPLTLEQVQQRKAQQQTTATPVYAPAVAPINTASSTQTTRKSRNTIRKDENTMSENLPYSAEEAAMQPYEGNVSYGEVSGQEALLTAYQATMRQFLQTQESIMMAYLTGSPVQRMARPAQVRPRPQLRAMPRAAQPTPRPASVAAAPAPVAVAPAPAPVKVSAAPAPAPVTPLPVSPPADAKSVASTLLGIVEDRTGYPQDMLGLEQNMEADLGIDSIKRVEIVGALLKALPPEMVQARSDASEALNGMKTLQGMIDFLSSMQSQDGAASNPFEQTGAGETQESGALLPRFIIEAQLENVDNIPLEKPAHGPWLITDDGNGVGDQLASLLQAEGATPVFIQEALLADDNGLQAFITEIRQNHGPIRGLVHLLPLSAPALPMDTSLAQWREQTRRNELSLYRLLQLAADDLQAGGRVLAATAMGGYFGRRQAPASGLIAAGGETGLLKSINDEWAESARQGG